jgi:Ca2+-binding RTX toxin-like protein
MAGPGRFDDRLWGGPLAERFALLSGHNRIGAGGGDDTVAGGEGNDTLVGGAGDDVLTGAAGADVLVFTEGADRITDFEDGIDRIHLRGWDRAAAPAVTLAPGENLVLSGPGGALEIANAGSAAITLSAEDFLF